MYPLWIDPDKVPLNSEKETVTVKVADVEASEDYKIEYENVVSEDKLGSTTLSGIANIEEVTSNSYEHIIYVNPRGDQGLINSNVTIENDVDHDSATFDEDVKNSVEVYKVKDSDKLPLSFGNNFDDRNYEKVENAEVKLVADGSKNKLVVNVNQGDDKNYDKDDAYDKSAYVIKYKGKRAPEKETKTKITYKADRRLLNGKKESLVTDGRFAWTWTNEIVFDDAEAVAEANRRAAERWSLGDKVWIDEDKNGSQGDNEKGLDGVTVTLRGINMSPRTTETKDGGKYIFEDLPNGEYTVEFEIPTGYAPTTANAEDVTEENNSDASKDTTNNKIAIATGTINGADNMNVDFGVIESEAPTPEEKTYSLGDKVWIDEDKDGIQGEKETGKSGVTVKLTGGDLTEAKTTTTDANGKYKFEGLKNGTYKVTFEIPEGYEATKIDQTKEGVENSDEIDSDATAAEDGKSATVANVTIKDANNDTIDLGLVKKETPVEETYTLGDRVWVDDNKDGLQTEGEKGLKDVTVKLTGGDLTEEKTTTTDENGNYKFEDLKNGTYKVTFEIPEGYEATKIDQTKEGVENSDEIDSDATAAEDGKSATVANVTIKDANNDTIDLGLVKKEKPTTPKEEPEQKEEPKEDPTPDPTPEETPVEEPKEDPAPKEEPKTEEPKEEETPEETPVEEAKEEEKEVVVEKEEDETDKSKDTTPKHDSKEDYSKAPQTGVAGAAGYLGLAGLGTALLAALEDKKKKKNK